MLLRFAEIRGDRDDSFLDLVARRLLSDGLHPFEYDGRQFFRVVSHLLVGLTYAEEHSLIVVCHYVERPVSFRGFDRLICWHLSNESLNVIN